MNANVLKKIIVEKGFTFYKISSLLGIGLTDLDRKLENKNDLTINEVFRLKHILDLSNEEAISIFLEA